MHKKDRYCGILLVGLGIWIAWKASAFPALAGMPYGAGLFPTIAALGLSVCGALILISSLIAERATPKTPAHKREYRPALNAFGVIVAVVFYATLFEPFGFHLISFMVLFFLFILLQVRWISSLVLATGVTIGVHFIFYSLLHVPLPWGILEPFAW